MGIANACATIASIFIIYFRYLLFLNVSCYNQIVLVFKKSFSFQDYGTRMECVVLTGQFDTSNWSFSKFNVF